MVQSVLIYAAVCFSELDLPTVRTAVPKWHDACEIELSWLEGPKRSGSGWDYKVRSTIFFSQKLPFPNVCTCGLDTHDRI